MAPFVVPGIVLAIAFYAAYAPPPLALYGTATILILALRHALPADRLCQRRRGDPLASIRKWRKRSASWAAAACSRSAACLAPLMKRSLIGAWLLVFIPATRELSTAMFLYGPNTRTMSVMLMDMSEEGNFETLAALGFLLLVSTLVIVGSATGLAGTRLHAAAGSCIDQAGLSLKRINARSAPSPAVQRL